MSLTLHRQKKRSSYTKTNRASFWNLYDQHFQRSMDQPGMVANLARGQLKREKICVPFPCSRLKIWSRETGLVRPVPRQPAHPPHSGYLVLTHGIPPAFHDRVHTYSTVYLCSVQIKQMRSRPRARWYRTSTVVLKVPVVRVTNGSCLFRCHHGPIFVRLSFSTSTT